MCLAGVPGEVVVVNSTIQFLRSNFSLNAGGATAAALSIDSSHVLIDSTTFANNTGAAAPAVKVSALP